MKVIYKGFLIAVMALLFAGCISTTGVKPADGSAPLLTNDDYQFGDLSVRYCAASNSTARTVLRIALTGVAASQGLQLGVDYCKAISHLSVDYSDQDIVSTWCNVVDPKEKAQIERLFKDKLASNGVILTRNLCEADDEPAT